MTNATTDQRWIERQEAARDLRNQISDISADDEQEIQFTEWSPGRKYVTLWNTIDGEEVSLPRYQAVAALNTPRPDGKGYMWTSVKENAPERKLGTVKCFLHPDAPERELLNEIGVTQVCMTEHLANETAKRRHARRHPSTWEQYQEEVTRRQVEADRLRADKQTDAIMKLATQRAKE